MARLTPEQQIMKAAQKKAKAEETIRRAQKILRDKDRKKDTRQKIILGGALIAAAENNESVAKFLAQLISRLDRPTDIAAFDGFSIPTKKR